MIDILEKYIAFRLYNYAFSLLLAFSTYKWQNYRLRKEGDNRDFRASSFTCHREVFRSCWNLILLGINA